MVITHKLRPMYLTCKNVTQRVDVMQDDKYSRCLEIPLRANGDDVELPEDVRAIVRYQKPDGTGGNYDTLPDGTSAYTVSGNAITVALAPQVCVVPGIVQMVVCLMQGNAEINTFVILVNVHRNPGIDAESQDYTNMRSYVKSYGWPPDKMLRTDADGNVIADDAPGGAATGGYYTPSIDTDGNLKWTASNPGMPEVGGANIKGQKGKTAYQYAVEGGYTGTEADFTAKMAELGDGLSTTEKTMLLSLFKNAAYTADMSATIAQLETLWSGDEEPDEPVTPDVTLSSISATYSGGSVPVGTAASSLTGVNVTAHYSDGSTATVTGYTLSGTIVEGNNTITVSYGGKTTTFNVTGVTDESGGDTEVSGDEYVVVTGATATDDGNGNVTVTGLTATDDRNGNITVS